MCICCFTLSECVLFRVLEQINFLCIIYSGENLFRLQTIQSLNCLLEWIRYEAQDTIVQANFNKTNHYFRNILLWSMDSGKTEGWGGSPL